MENNTTTAKLYVGPMSKNIVDSTIELANELQTIITLIPSRRQVEFDGGYVNNWTTEKFMSYIKSKTNLIEVQRDHAGPGQGYKDDDGYNSLNHDCKYLDLIHIDTWVKIKDIKEGVDKTIDLIKFCHQQNPNILFEIGTEEGIRPFSLDDISYMLTRVKKELTDNIFSKIKFCVIQSGTGLKETHNTGTYDVNKLLSMVTLVKKFNLLSKEHNGDYISQKDFQSRFQNGLDAINIAPELGRLESTILYSLMNEEQKEIFFEICLESNRWRKWVNEDFIPQDNKKTLVEICGHYVLSDNKFLSLKSELGEVEGTIKEKIKAHIKKLIEWTI